MFTGVLDVLVTAIEVTPLSISPGSGQLLRVRMSRRRSASGKGRSAPWLLESSVQAEAPNNTLQHSSALRGTENFLNILGGGGPYFWSLRRAMKKVTTATTTAMMPPRPAAYVPVFEEFVAFIVEAFSIWSRPISVIFGSFIPSATGFSSSVARLESSTRLTAS